MVTELAWRLLEYPFDFSDILVTPDSVFDVVVASAEPRIAVSQKKFVFSRIS